MKKIINTFKYGDKKVKIFLALAILAGIGTVASAVLAIAMTNMLLFFVTIVCAFITISLAQTFMIEEDGHPVVPGQPDFQKSKKGNAEIEAKRKVKHDKKLKVNKEKKVKKESKSNVTRKNEAVTLQEQQAESHEEPQPEMHQEIPQEKEAIAPIDQESVKKYNKKKIKKVMHKYKVKKDHRMVMVDRCVKLNIHQTPAYIWVEGNEFHLLLIEKEPRHIVLPLFKIHEISYHKKVEADENKDYEVFNKNTLITDTFRPYLPTYNHNSNTSDLSSYKNLYGIFQGIYFTNTSAGNLFDILGVEFVVEDKVTTSPKANIYFKNCYKANILLRDGVIDAQGYADRLLKILGDMAHSTISYGELKDTLNLLVKNKLITQEFAVYCMEERDKNSR